MLKSNRFETLKYRTCLIVGLGRAGSILTMFSLRLQHPISRVTTARSLAHYKLVYRRELAAGLRMYIVIFKEDAMVCTFRLNYKHILHQLRRILRASVRALAQV